ncbi:hypothetical protein TUN199_12084 [Pyrenophora tritici-repentis]|uniref:Uncharacterized protein n=1 Tax=Pyrenophora tritici-repentis TaxID=45151 RepID=A0A834VND5_9PLEO|nr:hypothetical protein PtrM4_112990 [Pyrenophora tritici-repentis]KAI0568245.1 hypothetical protein Alg215_12278 [Pyrenophora tritici-repentis]KAI0615947.1 hypothetical protein TUN199_12084 [Pyrenophora tritici-repentis]
MGSSVYSLCLSTALSVGGGLASGLAVLSPGASPGLGVSCPSPTTIGSIMEQNLASI